MIQGYGHGDIKICHGDFHTGNVFVMSIDDTVMWKGQRLIDADYFHYKAGNKNIYWLYSAPSF